MAGLKAALAAAAQRPGLAGPLLEVLVEALPLGVLLQDTDRRVVLVNTAFIRLAGISARPAELVGVTFDGSARHVLDLFEVGRREPPPGEQAAPGRTIERECVPLEAGGELLGQLWVLRDVTDQATARRTTIEQDRLAAELAVLRSDFVATVSHELRTPLTSIVGLSTLLLDDGAGRLDPEQTECLQAIERSADRLLRLADDLTLLAGLESQRVPLRAEPVDAIALIRHRAPAWQESAAAAGVELQLDHPDAGPPLRGDERLLIRMLDDLVAAAVAASAPGCQLRLSIRPAAGDWIIEIADPTLAAGGGTPGGPAAAGVPAAPGQANPLDGPGQRDQPSQPGDASRHGGGLGPIISQAIAKRHQGSLDVRSATNAWTIRVQLPAADAGPPPPGY
jgi:signal transduction histidine kinase